MSWHDTVIELLLKEALVGVKQLCTEYRKRRDGGERLSVGLSLLRRGGVVSRETSVPHP